MIREIPWEDDALEIGPDSDPVTIRYSFGNLAAYDRAASRRGLDGLWAGIGAVGPEAAVLFLLSFAEGPEGGRRYATEEQAVDGLRAVGFASVASAYVAVFNRSTEEFGLVPSTAEPEAGAEGKG